MTLRKKLAVLFCSALAVLGLPMLQGTAYAGGGNRQILLLDNANNAYSVLVVGSNQYGSRVSHCWNTPYFKNELSGWWWTGNVDVYSYPVGGCDGSDIVGESHVYISPNVSGDWYAVTNNPRVSTTATQQVEVYDNNHRINSIRIMGFNQDDIWVSQCWATPGWDTLAANWWWGGASVDAYASSTNCTGDYQRYGVTGGHGSVTALAIG
ncbi:hypothetical protein [Streptomyces sp. NPDC020983]|uniref:hypothetical protein n=1 Tax=Streptomyces sp. NPDC020983 TaxID=3365106 RepID=UPI00378B6004